MRPGRALTRPRDRAPHRRRSRPARGQRWSPGSGAGSPGCATARPSASGTRCGSPRSPSCSRSMLGLILVFTRPGRRRPALPLRRAAAAGLLPRRADPRGRRAEELGELDFRSLPEERQRAVADGDRPPRDGDHVRRLPGDPVPRAARGRDDAALGRLRHQSATASASVAAAARPLRAEPALASRAGPGRRRGGRSAASPSRDSASSTVPVRIRWSPPSIRSRSSQATHIRASSRRGEPSLSLQSTPSHLRGLGVLGGEAERELLLAGGEGVDAEAAGGADRVERARAAVEAGEHHRRVERERGDGVRGGARRAARARSR